MKSKAETLMQVVIIGIGIAGGAYFSNQSNLIHASSGHEGCHSIMHYGSLEVGQDSVVPYIESLEINKDPVAGWNLYVQVRNFRFSPEHASQKHQKGEGHAHLIINGQKVARVYSPWFHIDKLKPGINEIRVTLNANTHATLTVSQVPITRAKHVDLKK